MNNKPSNYAEWCEIFDEIESWEIGHFDVTVDTAIKQGSIKWVSGVAERFTNRLLDLINSRFNRLEQFYSDRCSLCNDFFDFSKTLISFRKELIFLKKLANLHFLPEEIKTKIQENILDFAKNAQQDLENGAKKDLTGELKRIVLSNRVDNI